MKKIAFTAVTVLALVAMLMNPTLVRADGEPPATPTESPTEVTPAPETPAPTDLPETASTPVPTEATVNPVETSAPITDPTSISTETPIPTEAVANPLEATPTETVSANEELTVADILQEIPAGTDIVVLDESGNPEALATQDAAEVIASGDPIWCPENVAPTPGANGCTAPFGSLSALVAGFVPTGNGTIWIETGTDTGGAVSIKGLDPIDPWSSAAHYTLTLQGGWTGIYGDATIGSNSIFTAPIKIENWDRDITINNITIDGTGGTGLSISTTHHITINNSTFKNNSMDGAYLYTDSYVTIKDSNFSRNNRFGVGISGVNYNANISNSTFSENGSDGLYIYTARNVSISGSNFTKNNTGIHIHTQYGTSNVNITNSIIHGNNIGIVAYVYSPYGSPWGNINLTLNCNQFKDNVLESNSSNNVTLTSNCSNDEEDDIFVILVSENSASYPIDCYMHSGFLYVWPNDDRVLVTCVPNGRVNFDHKENTKLPGDLEKGYQYASSFEVQVLQNGAPLSVMPKGGFIRVSFATEERESQKYYVMYWNQDQGAGGWDLLDHEFSLDTQSDHMILKGAQFIPELNREEVTTNFPGVFVLVQK